MTDEKNDDIKISDKEDGSVIVEIANDQEAHVEGAVETEAEKQTTDETQAADDDTDKPGDDEELREAKRNRRRAKKDLIRKTNQEKDARLVALARQNEEMARRISELERNTKSEHLMRLDKGIEDANTRLEYAKMKLAEATQNNDGQGMVDAQTLWHSANEEVRQLTTLKQQADQELRNTPRQPRQQERQAVDPVVQRNASDWISKNPWYNPDGSDRDSRIAKKIDETLIEEEWDPRDPDYWHELDSRLKKSLPHRYNADNETVREMNKPRNVVGSSGRQSSTDYGGSGRSQFVLSPARVSAIKEAGMWDNPESRARMIKQFMAYDRKNAGRS